MREEWSADDLAKLAELAPLKVRAKDIAVAIGKTKNAVIGKARRMGIALTFKKPPRTTERRRAQQAACMRRIRASTSAKPYTPKAAPMPLPKPQPVRPVAPFTITILELEPGMCKFPEGDRDFKFCGAPQFEHSPYCGVHHQLCFNPAPLKLPRAA